MRLAGAERIGLGATCRWLQMSEVPPTEGAHQMDDRLGGDSFRLLQNLAGHCLGAVVTVALVRHRCLHLLATAFYRPCQ